MNNINYQKKQLVIDTLIKLADSSPAKNFYSTNYYGNSIKKYDISQQELNNWINYIDSVLNILSDFTNQREVSLTKEQIRIIAFQNGSTNVMRALNIERELLNLTQRILQYY